VIWATLIVGASATTTKDGVPANAIELMTDSFYWGILVIALPTILGPAALYTFLLAPFSRTIWRAVAEASATGVP
jgi:hypothetical protein